MNPDFLDILSEFFAAKVEFLVVGAYALAAHGVPRATGDLDLWVRPTEKNAHRVRAALERFGAPLEEIGLADLTTEGMVFQIGVAPRRIDVLTSIDGVAFAEAWGSRVRLKIEGVEVPVLSREDLIRNKRALGRPKDLGDIDSLENG